MRRKVKRKVAWLLTAVMILSVLPMMQTSVAKADGTEPEYESLSQYNASSDVKVPTVVGESVTLTVAYTNTDDDLHYWAELIDKTDLEHWRYFTTVSDEESAWDPDRIFKYSVEQGESDISASFPGYVYEVTVTLKEDTVFSISYSNYTTGKSIITYTTETTNYVPENTIIHIINRSGKLRVYKGKAEENGFSASNNKVPVQPNHGIDRTKYYTEEDANNEVPADYTVKDETQGSAKDGIYNDYFLKEDIQTVKINIDNNNLNYLLQNASIKPSVLAKSVTIGDKTVEYVGLKTKGNNTLSTTYKNTDSDRYSFTVNFGKYIKKKYGYSATQNFYGCSKISFNCMRNDKTLMREYNSMRLMEEMGVPTPAYGMARLYINDQYYGVYFMVEAMDTNILKRYQKSSTDISDYLVKPFYTTPYYYSYFDSYLDANGEFTLESLSSVLYQDTEGVWQVRDPLTRISGMWENDPDVLQDVAAMIPTMLNWERKLTCLSNGTDVNGNTIDVNSNEYLSMVEDVFGDVDQVLRYFASHSYIIQMDNMFTWRQNFGLYLSKDGKAQIVPWDYDLAWGGLGDPETTEEIANWNRDIMYNNVNPYCNEYCKPLTYEPASYYRWFQGYDGTNVGTPLFNVLFQNDTLREKYHQYMNDCSIITTLGGRTSEGNKYSTGRFYSTMMNALYEKMKTAAGETLASNVYYLNGIQQPEAVTTAMPELAELISLRAVGVWLQNHSIQSKVCAGETSGGNLTIVDAATGIFASAEYEDDENYPSLTVSKKAEESAIYNDVKNKIDSKLLEGREINIYHLTDTKTPKADTGYTLYLPVSGGGQAIIYQYDGTKLEVLNAFSYENDDIAVAEVSDFSHDIVVVDYPRKDEETVKPITPWNASIEKDENVDSVDIYYTSTYGETPDETNVITASARNSKTGELDISGDGQINFRVNVKDGYEIDQITVTPVENYKNLKTPVDTNEENVYRITKIQGDISIVISTKKSEITSGATPTPGPTETPGATETPESTGTPGAIEAPSSTATPDSVESPAPTKSPAATESPKPTESPKLTVGSGDAGLNSGNAEDDEGGKKDSSSSVKMGAKVTVKKVSYKVTEKNAVEYSAPKMKSKTTYVIPNTVKINGKTYKVTSISSNAFKGCKKLKEITIGTNVKKIGKKAFYNCKKLNKITIKTTKLTSGNVGSNAFKGLPKKSTIRVPKKKLKAYKKLFRKKGFSGKVK